MTSRHTRSRHSAPHDSADTAQTGNEPTAAEVDDEIEAMAVSAGEHVDVTVESRAHGWRLDHYLSRLFANHSRAELQRIIESEHVLLNGLVPKASRRLRVNDRIAISLPDAEHSQFVAEDIPLDVLYEDDAIVVINKAAGMVVHPGRGTYSGTLAAALQFHFDQLSNVAGRHRPGIVHRLDRDTTGVILIARDNQIHQKVSRQFEQRQVKKEYRAIVRGHPEMASDFIRTFVCVHSRVREKMMVCAEGGNAREAVTFYRTAEKFRGYALMDLHPQTGRTHQLRVHMQHIGTPIIADKLYTGESQVTKRDLLGADAADASGAGHADEVLMQRQALHAFRLTIQHPVSGKSLTFEAPLPPDFVRTLDVLRDA